MNENDTQSAENAASSSNPEGTGWQPVWQVNQLPSANPQQSSPEQYFPRMKNPDQQSWKSLDHPNYQGPTHTQVHEHLQAMPITNIRLAGLLVIGIIMWMVSRDIFNVTAFYINYQLRIVGLRRFIFLMLPYISLFGILIFLAGRLSSGNRKLLFVITTVSIFNGLIFSIGYGTRNILRYLLHPSIIHNLVSPQLIWVPILTGVTSLGVVVYLWTERRKQNFHQPVFNNWEIKTPNNPKPLAKPHAITARELRGQVHGFRERTETKGSGNPFSQHTPTIVWTYRLERYQKGERMDPIPVEMRGHSFTGLINDGDEIMINKKWRKGQMLRTNRVFNLTSGAEVKTLRRISANTIAHIVFYIFLAAIIFFWLVYLGN